MAVKVFQYIKSKPMFFSFIANGVDDFIVYIKQMDTVASIKGNVITNAIVFSLIMSYKKIKIYKDWRKGKITSFKQALHLFLQEFFAGGATFALSCGGAAIGAFVGNLIFPVAGAAIGGLIGSLLSSILSKKYLEDKIKAFMASNYLISNKIVVKDAYLEALKNYGLIESSTVEEIKRQRRTFLLNYHPDKHSENKEEYTKRHLEYETYFNIIKEYRLAENRWTD